MAAQLPFGTGVGDWNIVIPVDGVVEISHGGTNMIRLPAGRCSVMRPDASTIEFRTDSDATFKITVSAMAVSLSKDGNVLASLGDFDENILFSTLHANFPVSIVAAAVNPGAVMEDPAGGGRRRKRSTRRRRFTRR